jgi:hypothetical protein
MVTLKVGYVARSRWDLGAHAASRHGKSFDQFVGSNNLKADT